MSKQTFLLTEDHIKLLENAYISTFSSNYYYEAIGFDEKRPYGNSDIAGDIYEIINGAPIDENDEEAYSQYEQEESKYIKLHNEMSTALQIVLHNKSFKTGLYELIGYGKDWKLIEG